MWRTVHWSSKPIGGMFVTLQYSAEHYITSHLWGDQSAVGNGKAEQVLWGGTWPAEAGVLLSISKLASYSCNILKQE